MTTTPTPDDELRKAITEVQNRHPREAPADEIARALLPLVHARETQAAREALLDLAEGFRLQAEEAESDEAFDLAADLTGYCWGIQDRAHVRYPRGAHAMTDDTPERPWRTCERCNYDRHLCPGCGTDLPHGTEVCSECRSEAVREDIRDGRVDPPAMTDDTYTPTDEGHLYYPICGPCVRAEGEECHTPGCALFLHDVPDHPIHLPGENLAARDARVRAEAVRDAADWLDGFSGPGGRSSLHDRVGRDLIRLLRERAARLAQDTGQEGGA